MSARRTSYDVKCYDLAEHFVRDVLREDDPRFRQECHSLAQEIQRSVEDWFLTQLAPPP
jgi:hypothetical protein